MDWTYTPGPMNKSPLVGTPERKVTELTNEGLCGVSWWNSLRADTPRGVRRSRICLPQIRGLWFWFPFAMPTCSSGFLCWLWRPRNCGGMICQSSSSSPPLAKRNKTKGCKEDREYIKWIQKHFVSEQRWLPPHVGWLIGSRWVPKQHIYWISGRKWKMVFMVWNNDS
jgi:hypothetical protein